MRTWRIVAVCCIALLAISVQAKMTQEEFNAFKAGFESMMKQRSQIKAGDDLTALTCSFNGYDFSSLQRSTDFKVVDGTFTYRVNPCGITNQPGDCQSQKGTICQKDNNGDDEFTLAAWSEPAPVWSMRNGEVVAEFQNGPKTCYDESTGNWVSRDVNLHFYCSPDEGNFLIKNIPGTCIYDLKFPTPIACGGGGAGEKGISGGTVFLIIVLVSVFLYVVIGCIYNVKKNLMPVSEACPHKTFWLSIPGLVKDGCVFTWGKLRSLCGKTQTTSSGEYETTI